MSQAVPAQEHSATDIALFRWLVTSGNFFFWFRSFLIPITCVLGLFLTQPALFGGDPRLDRIAIAIGIVTALAGQAIRLLVIGFAYIKRGG